MWPDHYGGVASKLVCEATACQRRSVLTKKSVETLEDLGVAVADARPALRSASDDRGIADRAHEDRHGAGHHRRRGRLLAGAKTKVEQKIERAIEARLPRPATRNARWDRGAVDAQIFIGTVHIIEWFAPAIGAQAGSCSARSNRWALFRTLGLTLKLDVIYYDVVASAIG